MVTSSLVQSKTLLEALFLIISGKIICYSESSKKEIWRNSLSGCGYPLGSTIVYYSSRLWVGLNGKFLGLDVNTGEEFTRFELEKCSGFVSLLPFKGMTGMSFF